MPSVDPIPSDYPRVIPHLSVADAGAAIDFYTSVLGATERVRMPMPDGSIVHAEIAIGDSVIMLGDEAAGNTPSAKTLGGSPTSLYVYVEDVDATFARATRAGAKEVQAPDNQFYGDRTAVIEDPWGYTWNIAARVEDVPPEEMEKRMAAVGQGN